MRWIADEAGDVRLGEGVDPPSVSVIARVQGAKKFETITDYNPTTESGFSVLGFSRDPNTILVAANRPSESDPAADRTAIYEFSLSTKKFGDVVLEHDELDIEGRLINRPGTREPVALQYTVDRPEMHFLDEQYAALQQAGVAAELYVVKDGDHARGGEFGTPELHRMTVEFLQQHLQ